MRLLHAAPVYAPAWSYGGTVRSVTAIAEAVASLGVHVTVVTTTVGTEWSKCRESVWREVNGVEVCYCPGRITPAGIWSTEAYRVLRARAAQSSVGHITSCWIPFGVAALRAFQRSALPFVSSPRGCISSYSFADGWWKKWPYFWLFERRIEQQAAVLHATSPLEVSDLRRYFPHKEIALIPNMCRTDRWFPDPVAGAEWRRRHGIPPGTLIALYVGRVEPKKNLPFLAKVQQAMPKGRQFRVVLMGPAETQELEKVLGAYRARDLEPPLLLPGTGDDRDLRAAYSAADVFVLPSHHENFSNVVVEAAMCGTPVVASPNVGVAHAMSGLACAQLVQPDPIAWASAILGAASSRLDQSRVGELGSTFTPAYVAGELVALYRRHQRLTSALRGTSVTEVPK